MDKQKEARTEGVAPNRLAGTVEDDRRLSQLCQAVADLLGHGEEEAVSSVFLCGALGLSKRALRKEVKREREECKILILSSGAGYFLPSLDPVQAQREIKAFYDCWRSRLLSGFPFLHTLENRLSISPAQTAMEELGE